MPLKSKVIMYPVVCAEVEWLI